MLKPTGPRRLLLCCALLPLVAAPLAAQSADPARALLRRTASIYRKAESYHFAATESAAIRSGEIEKKTKTFVLTARDPEGRTRVEFDDGGQGGVAVFDGSSHWVYIPSMGKYAELPPPSNSGGKAKKVGGIDFAALAQRYLDRYRTADERVISAELVKRETVGMRDGEAMCQVVEVAYSPPPGMREGEINRSYWINEANGLVVKERSTASMFHQQAGARVEVVQEIDFQAAKAAVALPAALFQFVPPLGAQQVESFRPEAVEGEESADLEAPDFTLSTLAGESVQLSSLRGNVVLLDFWATWCGPCRYDMPHVDRLYQQYGSKGLKVFGVNSEQPQRAQDYLAYNNFQFPTLSDPRMNVARLYQVNAIPTFVVIDRQGRIRSYFRGTRTAQQLYDALKQAGL